MKKARLAPGQSGRLHNSDRVDRDLNLKANIFRRSVNQKETPAIWDGPGRVNL